MGVSVLFLDLNWHLNTTHQKLRTLDSSEIPERLGFELEATPKQNRLNLQTNKPSDTLVYARFNADNLSDLSVTWGAST